MRYRKNAKLLASDAADLLREQGIPVIPQALDVGDIDAEAIRLGDSVEIAELPEGTFMVSVWRNGEWELESVEYSLDEAVSVASVCYSGSYAANAREYQTLSPSDVENLPVGSLVFEAVDGRPQGQALIVSAYKVVTPISILPERADGGWPGGDHPAGFANEFLLIEEGRGKLVTHGVAQRKAIAWFRGASKRRLSPNARKPKPPTGPTHLEVEPGISARLLNTGIDRSTRKPTETWVLHETGDEMRSVDQVQLINESWQTWYAWTGDVFRASQRDRRQRLAQARNDWHKQMTQNTAKRASIPRLSGDVEYIEAHGRRLQVKKLKQGEYFALVDGEQQGRFGDADQIRDDIEYFLEGGSLPRGKVNYSKNPTAASKRCWGEQQRGVYITPRGKRIIVAQKANKFRFYYEDTDQQVGPEVSRLRGVIEYAGQHGWLDEDDWQRRQLNEARYRERKEDPSPPRIGYTAADVRNAARRIPTDERYLRGEKVWVSDLMSLLPGLTKQQLLAMHRRGEVELNRADMVQAVPEWQEHKIDDSYIDHLGAEYHVVRL